MELSKSHQRYYDKLRERVESFIKEKGISDQIAHYVLLAPDLFVLLARLLVDKRVSTSSKATAAFAVAYFISPVDLIPEVITGPIGYLDDIVLAVYALRKILIDTDQVIVLEHWNGKDDLLQVITNTIQKADDLVGSNILKKIESLLFNKTKGK
ncbi:YkvA family protein [Brevibacillus daliensis]|uniref:YkvA family protein n=1 Tax=Brevibacillus daliensis TaxID=2892995 RepID=UPI0035A07B6B